MEIIEEPVQEILNVDNSRIDPVEMSVMTEKAVSPKKPIEASNSDSDTDSDEEPASKADFFAGSEDEGQLEEMLEESFGELALLQAKEPRTRN